jgi:hypothetical protein
MDHELWNTRNDIRVAIWASEAEARQQLRRQPGLQAEPHRLLARSGDGSTRVVAEQDQLLAWAAAGAAS